MDAVKLNRLGKGGKEKPMGTRTIPQSIRYLPDLLMDPSWRQEVDG